MSGWRDLAYGASDPAASKEEAKDATQVASDDEDDDSLDDDEKTVDAELGKKLFTILELLRGIDNHDYVSVAYVHEKTGYDLDAPLQAELRKALERNDKIQVDNSAVPARIKFKPKYVVRSLSELLALLESNPDGILLSDIFDSSSDPGRTKKIVAAATVSGLIITVKKLRSTAEAVLYPRGPSFFVPLTGTFEAPATKRTSLITSSDVRSEVRRGDTVVIGAAAVQALREENFDELLTRAHRVSVDTSLSTDEPTIETVMEQLSKSNVPYSASSVTDSAPRKGAKDEVVYKYKFNERKLPLSPSLAIEDMQELKQATVYKHGCTNDIRQIWQRVSEKTCMNVEQKLLLRRELAKEGLLTEAELKHNTGSNQNEVTLKKGKKRRRRQNRAYKVTNTHMERM